ncbi:MULTISPECIES: porin [unclassified Nitratiruptor]|uniref:porin n=1 Tax=unclassified Nitratiruptor TaxID=2624044 RepID=UPI001914F20B|nr:MULTISPECIES: porin [unclassified Nitratiruptor]BCD60790.1 hypothetical protein NitYY0810_C1568 [Nitratiruptor sp. YY08-10]BCD64722.1 hypothetical protein NitYY0814_C1576 [Nitratiruptor sp. YY08-14]
MKLAKLSLAAIVALGVSAFADVQNVKFSGDAKLYYGTDDSGNNDLFDQANSAGQVALDLAATADVGDGAKAKLAITMLDTLGLENNLVSNVWEGNAQNQWWVSEAWLAKTIGNTTVKLGRQEIDTPLAFTEKWSIAKNTFDAAVVLNNDLPQTTLVAAWIGQGNNAGSLGTTTSGAYAGIVNTANASTDPFTTFATEGAYAVGAITKAIPNTTAQVWYYNVAEVATAWWLQADVDLKEVASGLTFGVQYANIDPEATGADNASAWAVKVGYGMENLNVSASYSSADEDGAVQVANVAGQQTKLYTEAWWNYGWVGRAGADSFHIDASYNMENIADFAAYYTYADVDTATVDDSMTEFTVTASKSFGSLDATVAYIYTDIDSATDDVNTIQVYLTYNF